MKRKWLFKNLIITFVCFGAMVLLGTGSSKAVLQSNGNTGATYSLNDWMINVRKMEALGGAMGLSETLNSNLTSSSNSNNIDVHMEKNTEYGALAILSASSYGNPNIINDGGTTTGNVTGVVMKINGEWVAAAANGNAITNYYNANARYKNTYKMQYVAKNGDAISETNNWHSSTNSNAWIRYDTWSGIVRSFGNSIFSYSGNTNWYTASSNSTYYTPHVHYSRAVIVQGNGI